MELVDHASSFSGERSILTFRQLECQRNAKKTKNDRYMYEGRAGGRKRARKEMKKRRKDGSKGGF